MRGARSVEKRREYEHATFNNFQICTIKNLFKQTIINQII